MVTQAGTSSTGHSETIEPDAGGEQPPCEPDRVAGHTRCAPAAVACREDGQVSGEVHAYQIRDRQLVFPSEHEGRCTRRDRVKPTMRGEVNEIAVGDFATDLALVRIGAEPGSHAVRPSDRLSLDGGAGQSPQRRLRIRVECRIPDDERPSPGDRLVEGHPTDERRCRQVREHVRLAQRMAVPRQHVKRQPVEAPVGNATRPAVVETPPTGPSTRSLSSSASSPGRPLLQLRCTAWTRRASAPLGRCTSAWPAVLPVTAQTISSRSMTWYSTSATPAGNRSWTCRRPTGGRLCPARERVRGARFNVGLDRHHLVLGVRDQRDQLRNVLVPRLSCVRAVEAFVCRLPLGRHLPPTANGCVVDPLIGRIGEQRCERKCARRSLSANARSRASFSASRSPLASRASARASWARAAVDTGLRP